MDRCGYGPRLPFLLISPFAKTNYVSSSLTDQSSITAFIENNWLAGARIGPDSMDQFAGSLGDMFTFKQPVARPLFLKMTGELAR